MIGAGVFGSKQSVILCYFLALLLFCFVSRCGRHGWQRWPQDTSEGQGIHFDHLIMYQLILDTFLEYRIIHSCGGLAPCPGWFPAMHPLTPWWNPGTCNPSEEYAVTESEWVNIIASPKTLNLNQRCHGCWSLSQQAQGKETLWTSHQSITGW